MTVPRGIIGVLHLPPMPGDPRYRAGGFGEVESHVLNDAEMLVEGGVDALILENFGSAPFTKGTEGHRLPPHQVAAMAIIARAAMTRFGRPVGINCLRNDARSAIGIAAAVGASFIRVNVHTGAYVTDQGLIEGEAAMTLRYRDALGVDIAVLADVMVKHAAPLVPIDTEQAVHDTVGRGLADAIVVTGVATGAPVDVDHLARVRGAAGDGPVVLGSGLRPETVGDVKPYVDAAIVGTFFKEHGEVHRPVELSRVAELVAAWSA